MSAAAEVDGVASLLKDGSQETAPEPWRRRGYVDCSRCLAWREGGGNPRFWKALTSVCFIAEVAAYIYAVKDFPALIAISVLFLVKNLVSGWAQQTPTWFTPEGPFLWFFVYCFGLPGVLFVLQGCPAHGDVVFPYRDLVGFVLFVFGSGYSLAYELGRIRWKALPENRGRLHTVGLASLCIHPNYFGDLFAYSGWAIAGGTMCGLSVGTFQIWMFVYMVMPNSDAYLAERYPAEFPAYAAKTASLIPFFSPVAHQVVAWVGFAASCYFGTHCSSTLCG